VSARRVPWVLALALLAPGVAPPGAAAALGVTIPGPAALPTLAPGQTVTSPQSLITVAALTLEAWSLKVSDDSGSAGHLTRASATGACAASEPALATPLHLSSTSALASLDAPELDLTGTPVTVAHGIAAGSVAVRFTQAIGQMEPIAAGCTYQTTLTWTVIGG
jgi:hypothetical protein